VGLITQASRGPGPFTSSTPEGPGCQTSEFSKLQTWGWALDVTILHAQAAKWHVRQEAASAIGQGPAGPAVQMASDPFAWMR
jgi:hypothetical protein